MMMSTKSCRVSAKKVILVREILPKIQDILPNRVFVTCEDIKGLATGSKNPQLKQKPDAFISHKASAPASAGGTDQDLAAPQFRRNYGAYNIIEF